MEILVIDNYDSFTYNLVHMLKAQREGLSVVVKRNDQITLNEVSRFSKIVLSPGPGIPCEAGIMPEVVREFGPTKAIVGVCLGHQCIGEVYGAKLRNIEAPIHGKATPMRRIAHDDLILEGLPDTIAVGRYHSWVVDRNGFPADTLEITAVDDAGEIMALRHRTYRVFGVQFHPESILTPDGERMIANMVRL